MVSCFSGRTIARDLTVGHRTIVFLLLSLSLVSCQIIKSSRSQIIRATFFKFCSYAVSTCKYLLFGLGCLVLFNSL